MFDSFESRVSKRTTVLQQCHPGADSFISYVRHPWFAPAYVLLSHRRRVEGLTQRSHPAWASNGGITGRGVLLDYHSWASNKSLSLSPFSSTVIPFSHLQHVIADQNVTFRRGDILFIRSGFTAAYEALSDSEKLALSKRARDDFIGVEPTKEVLQWLWENQFAAVAGDMPAFERSPVGQGKDEDDLPPQVVLHQWLLGGWGMPIGEMFDLEELAKHCRECQRWSFFLSSVPLKAGKAQSLILLIGQFSQRSARI